MVFVDIHKTTDPRCPEGYEYVHSCMIKGTYVPGFCRKKSDKRRKNNPGRIKGIPPYQ